MSLSPPSFLQMLSDTSRLFIVAKAQQSRSLFPHGSNAGFVRVISFSGMQSHSLPSVENRICGGTLSFLRRNHHSRFNHDRRTDWM